MRSWMKNEEGPTVWPCAVKVAALGHSRRRAHVTLESRENGTVTISGKFVLLSRSIALTVFRLKIRSDHTRILPGPPLLHHQEHTPDRSTSSATRFVSLHRDEALHQTPPASQRTVSSITCVVPVTRKLLDLVTLAFKCCTNTSSPR
jgi:hypothetical protein